MMMKILIGTDGSDFSTAAAEKLCDFFGDKPGLSVVVVSVFEEVHVLATEPFAVSAEYYQEMSDAAKNQATHFAEETAKIISERCPGADVRVEVVRGKPATCITDLAGSAGADLIVVGSHGRGFWGRMLGSVSNAVVNHAPCSVMIVRREE
jgi:nucleotide-binding universal stress UspA family protein